MIAITQFIIFFFFCSSLVDTFTTSDNKVSYSLSMVFSILSPLNNSVIVISKAVASGSIRDTSGNPILRSHLEIAALNLKVIIKLIPFRSVFYLNKHN